MHYTLNRIAAVGEKPYKPNEPCEQPTFCSEHNLKYIANTASRYKP